MSSIRDYWLAELAQSAEFKAIADTEDIDFSVLTANTAELMDDQFIQTATEYGIARREKLLNIAPKAGDALETRRARVALLWDNALPYTYRQLENKLNEITGGEYTMVLNHNAYTLVIKLEYNYAGLLGAVQAAAEEMVPANIVLTVDLRYRTHGELTVFTHAQLAAYTHDEIRELPLP